MTRIHYNDAQTIVASIETVPPEMSPASAETNGPHVWCKTPHSLHVFSGPAVNGKSSPPPSAEDAEVERAMSGDGGGGETTPLPASHGSRTGGGEDADDEDAASSKGHPNQRKMTRTNSAASSVVSGEFNFLFVLVFFCSPFERYGPSFIALIDLSFPWSPFSSQFDERRLDANS